MLNTTEPDKLTYPKRPPYLSIRVSRLSRQFRIAAYPVCEGQPDKFQALAVGERTHNEKPTFRIWEVQIECERTVKLLDVEIDYLLKFDDRISDICRKASQQINVLKRIGFFF